MRCVRAGCTEESLPQNTYCRRHRREGLLISRIERIHWDADLDRFTPLEEHEEFEERHRA